MKIRPATLEDAQRLFEWRNDPLTRSMFRNREIVEWPDHLAWLRARLAREEPNLFVAEVDGVAVGTFRVDDHEVSYTVAPEARGQGHGYVMIRKAREMFGPLLAEIYERNTASIKVAERAGMIVRVLATPNI